MLVFLFVLLFLCFRLTSSATQTPLKYLQITCPDDSQRRLRFLVFCPNKSTKYSCLDDTENESDKEHCLQKIDFTTPGQKYVWTNNLRNVPCSYSRYQPFRFVQDQGKMCIYQKSLCNEDGQVIYFDRSLLEDRTCSCDHTQNYSYVTKPKNECYCIPSEEDCSCYKKRCNENEVLGSDYECVSADNKATKSRCPVLLDTSVKPKIHEKKIKHKDDRIDLVDTDSRVVVTYVVLAAILILILATLTLLFVNTVLFKGAQPEAEYTKDDSRQPTLSSMEGDTDRPNDIQPTRCRADVCSGVNNYITKQSEKGDSDSLHVLLQMLRSRCTNMSVWRRILIHELVQYHIDSDECDGKLYLSFLAAIFKSAIGAATVNMHTNKAPERLNQTNLHKLLRAMNLMIDERDTNNVLQYLCVYRSDSTNIGALKQFHQLVQALRVCDWQVLVSVLVQPEGISDGYKERLFQTLLNCTEPGRLEKEEFRQEEIADLYSSETYFMRRLGFYREKPSEPIFWTAPKNQAHETLITILSGLYAPKIHRS